MIDPETLDFELRDGHAVCCIDTTMIVRIERPQKANCLDVKVCEAMSETFDEFARGERYRAGILTGSGRHFCAGMDLGMVAPDKRIVLPATGFGGLTSRWLSKPLIAAVHGAVYGGGLELALACDLILADTTARFCLPETGVGQAALAGGLERLPRRIGAGRALDMVLTGREIDTDTAVSWGLVTRTCDPSEIVSAAVAAADELARRAPLALSVSKAVLRQTDDSLSREFVEETIGTMLDSKDAVEGARAFSEGRKPNWSGQ